MSEPAFPSLFDSEVLQFDKDGHRVILYPGMSLRDYFAAQALMGMHARDVYDNGQRTPEQRAALAYIDADAMLKERAKP